MLKFKKLDKNGEKVDSGGKDSIVSNANIMLLNDIDLDDMLQDDKNGKRDLNSLLLSNLNNLIIILI
ncbi:MAG: hypothetical protein L6V95_02780 [Candidatus Melainabacteria bacterium]|nr:MAG: hypothetical protein L6V95_02780 [Candidatus Melainabacteria bacterium]